MGIRYSDRITNEGYLRLRELVDWPKMSEVQASRTIQGSSRRIAAWDGDTMVGCARVVDDGGYMFFIVDVMVDPAYQGRGIGRFMVKAAIEYCYSVRENEQELGVVNLMSAYGKEDFYRKLGFIERPNDHMGAGMCFWM